MGAKRQNRKAEEEDEERKLMNTKNTFKYLKKLDDAEVNAEIAEVRVNEEDLVMSMCIARRKEPIY